MRPTTEAGAEIEYRVLTTEAGSRLLAAVAEVASPGPADLTRWRKTAAADEVAAALRIVTTRRKADGKFTHADRMWFEPTALEQSTAEAVARHKSRRFAGAPCVDLCCGIGGDSLAIAGEGSRVIAVDRDGGMLRRLRWNAEVYGVSDRIDAAKARAESLAIPSEARVHVDPDRRSSGRGRARDVAGYQPELSTLLRIASTSRGGAFKLGPASDFETHFAGPGFEVEVISLRGECKEATVWFGDLSESRRIATVLPEGVSWTGRPGTNLRVARSFADFLFEPDAALVRASLVDDFAGAHALARIGVDVPILTGDEETKSPFLTRFEVLWSGPLDLRVVKRELREKGESVGEIKTLGVKGKASEEAARQLGPVERGGVTVFLVNAREQSLSFLARRMP